MKEMIPYHPEKKVARGGNIGEELEKEKYQYDPEKGLEGTQKLIFNMAEEKLKLKISAAYEGKLRYEREAVQEELDLFLSELKSNAEKMNEIIRDLNIALVADQNQGTSEGEDKIAAKFSENLADGLYKEFFGSDKIDH